MSREAMQMALEALESDPISHAGIVSRKQAITALRQALETEQEPREAMKQPEALRLADALDAEFVQGRISNSTGRESAVELRRLALKQWVSLTDGEIDILSCETVKGNKSVNWLCKVLEAKLKEKNHG